MEACFELVRPPVPIPHQRHGGATGWSSGRLMAGYSLLCLSSSRSNFMDSAGTGTGTSLMESICGSKKEESRQAIARTVTRRSSSSSQSFCTSPDPDGDDEDPRQEKQEDNNDDDDCVTLASSEEYGGYSVDGVPAPPEWLGINPEPPDWPASRHVMFVAGGERQMMSDAVAMPLSLRMLKKKRRALMSSCAAAEGAQCLTSSPSSVKRALSSLLFMIRELHSYTLQLYQHLFYDDEDGAAATNAKKMQSIIAYVHKEVQASFCWLFHHVFSCTPTLMVSLMLLLANFTVYSMAHSAAAVPPRLRKTAAVVVSAASSEEAETGVTAAVAPEQLLEGEEEARAWRRILEEAAAMVGDEACVIPIIVPVPPVAVEVEPDGMQSEHYRTELRYKKAVEEEPRNPLLLSNYAQFLHVVVHDHARAEEFYRRAAAVEPVDGEAVCQYANFLWSVRNDVAAAEEAYLKAIAADPSNSNYAASYAHFLWCTGGDDTCQNPTWSPEGDAAGDVF